MFSDIGRTYIAGLLSPTSFIGFALVIATILLWKKKVAIAKWIVTVCAVSFLILATAPLKYTLFTALEDEPQTIPNDYEYVVVLGGKIFPHEEHPVSSQITPSLLSRLSHAASMVIARPDVKLILTGNGAESKTEAEVMESFALQMGIAKDRIILEKKSMNTADHPIYLKSILQGKKFVIVTSAYHMKRAMELFRKHGLEGYAAPTDYQNKQNLGLSSFIMRGENLSAMDRLFTEFYSSLWQKIKSLF